MQSRPLQSIASGAISNPTAAILPPFNPPPSHNGAQSKASTMQNNVTAPAVTATATAATTTAKPVAPVTPSKPVAKAKRKPVAKPVAPVTAKPDTTAATIAQTTSRGLARDAATVAARATFFAQYSDRDTAYLTFFGGVMRANSGKATLAQIHEAGADAGKNKKRNPHYAGSAKATDAGAINRLIKAGYITASATGNVLTATAKATATAAYNGKA